MIDSNVSGLCSKVVASTLRNATFSRAPLFAVTSFFVNVVDLFATSDLQATPSLSQIVGGGYSSVKLHRSKSEILNDMQLFCIAGILVRKKAELGTLKKTTVSSEESVLIRSRIQRDVLDVISPEGLLEDSQMMGGTKLVIANVIVPTSKGRKAGERGGFRERFENYLTGSLEGFSFREHPNSHTEIKDDWLSYAWWGTNEG